MSNATIAGLLRRYASVIALEGANRFKVKAYRRAAETIESSQETVAGLLSRGADLTELPNVGQAISGVIAEIAKAGSLPRLEEAERDLAPGLVDLAGKVGLDPKKILRVYKKLQISSLDELRARLAAGDIKETFGERLEFQLRHALDERPRLLLWKAQKLVPAIETYLIGPCGATRVAEIGSLRRKRDTIADLGFLVSGATAATIFKRFARFGAVESSEKLGRQAALFHLSAGIAVKLVCTPESSWGLTLLLHTGSGEHVRHLEALAGARQSTLTPASLGQRAADEGLIYKSLGLSFIPPELREDRGEIEAAAAHRLPRLVEVEDLQGDLHMHTTASDGANTIEEMAQAAKKRGYKYIAITDHSQSLKITNGLTEERLFEQLREIDRVNARLRGITVLKSSEVDILEDGRLDYSNTALRELDLVICSIHSRFALDKERQTERLMRAMDNPYFNILGHATGRLLLQREGYGVDMERLIRHAKGCGCYFEINSSPNRLDLCDEHARMCKEAGVKIAVNTDAHSIAELRFITAGLNQARRGWLEASDVLNTMPLTKLKKALRR